MLTKTSYIITHGQFSKGARNLSRELGIKKMQASPYNVQWSALNTDKHLLINWGNSQLFMHGIQEKDILAKVVNQPVDVSVAVDKVAFFKRMSRADNPPRLPEYTESAKDAVKWVEDGATVMARGLTKASSGRGIVFYGEGEMSDFMNAKLFTKYVKKMAEYRVHFAFGKQIDQQKKGLRHDIDKTQVDMRVRTHSNGFVFLRENITLPPDVVTQAERAYKASGLDFGAVDVIWNQHLGRAYVLEINTAPGLEGTTVDRYATAFREAL